MRTTRCTPIPRSRRSRIVLGLALAGSAAVLAGAFMLNAPTTVRGSVTVDAARPHKVTGSTAPRSVAALDVAGRAPSSTTVAPTTTTVAPALATVATVPTTVPSRTVTPPATTPPETTPPATTPPPTDPPTGVSAGAACNAKLADLRAQGYVSPMEACVPSVGNTYYADVHNGTQFLQIIVDSSGHVVVG